MAMAGQAQTSLPMADQGTPISNGVAGALNEQDTVTYDLPESINKQIENFQAEVQPILNQIKDMEARALTLKAQIESKRARVNGQIEGFLIGKGVALEEKDFELKGKKVEVRPKPPKPKE